MPTNHPLHPIAAQRLEELADELERGFGRTDSDRKIVNAVVYGITPAQVVGMLEAFARDRREYNDQHRSDPNGAQDRAVAGK